MQLVRENDTAEFHCSADANPIDKDTIKWQRKDYKFDDNDRVRMSFNNETNTAYLTIYNIKKEDMGAFDCVVNNGIGSEAKNTTFLLVRSKY